MTNTLIPRISGCTPEIASNVLRLDSYGPIVTSALEALADLHELSSQDDLCVIGAIHAFNRPCEEDLSGLDVPISYLDPDGDEDILVLPHCVMGFLWRFGVRVLDAPPPMKSSHLVSFGCQLMVQTYALDILALATCGRMTPLRLWRLAVQQGFGSLCHPCCLKGVNYGAITGQSEQTPREFPGFTATELMELENIGDVEAVKERLVDEGFFWLWMAPDR